MRLVDHDVAQVREHVEDGQVEAEALPARGARRHDGVAAGAKSLPGLGLMAVERCDPSTDERGRDARVEVVREWLRRPAARRLDGYVRELAALEQLEPGGRDDAHEPYASLHFRHRGAQRG